MQSFACEGHGRFFTHGSLSTIFLSTKDTKGTEGFFGYLKALLYICKTILRSNE